ncbi:tRNA 2-selenouridine(34) synthase MnmH [Haloimpatiens sp. FM7330]|uniref:tRNA 2-selenouridine(34) synthase MnmH n=1 Tax=Haloimpatiens sp. FM7330 TaxID=3298610 RepID=UPI003643E5C3
MVKDIDYKDLDGKYVLVDLRSPKEHEEYTIPGSVNVPILDNKEREEVGTVYVNESVKKAKRMGVEAVSNKLPQIYDKILELEKQYGKIVFFCARGGLRSSVLTMLMMSLGVKACKLKGGYKGYRAFINSELPKVNEKVNYIVVHGNTGLGKTRILKKLEKEGFEVLDLEGYANHRGSLLGSVGIGKCNSQKQFESSVYEKLKNLKSNYVFVEGESKRIGRILIPDSIYNNMKSGKHILIRGDIDYRAKIIVEEYTKCENCQEQIIESLYKLERYVNHDRIEKYVEMVKNQMFSEVAKELMIKYYDPMYKNGEKKYEYDLTLNIDNINEACDSIIKWSEKNSINRS